MKISSILLVALCISVAFGMAQKDGGMDGIDANLPADANIMDTNEIKDGGQDGMMEGQMRTAPDFELKNYDGRTIQLSDYQGKVVVLEWVNENCPFSMFIHEKGKVSDLVSKWEGEDVIWLGINSSSASTVQSNKDFAQKQDIKYPILDDSMGKVGKEYGAKTTPHIFIIDKNGKIVYEGAFDNAPMGKTDGEYVNYVDKALSDVTKDQKVQMSKTDPYGCTVKYKK